MMKFGRALLAALVLLVPATALAQNNFATPGGSTAAGSIAMCINGSGQAVPCSLTVPLQIAGTFSATLGGFAPAGTFATLTATASSASVALPAGAVVMFQNTGTTAVSCTLGIGSATATASQNIVQPASWLALTVGSNTFGACIDVTGSTSNLVALSGGTGLPTGAGGGGGSGGGGAVTAASGAYASGSIASGALAVGAGADGWDVGVGATTATAATVGSAGNVNAKLRLMTSQLDAIATSVAGAIPAGAAEIGNVKNSGTFAVQAASVLAAETTKVIGTVRNADGSGNLYVADPCSTVAQTSTPISITTGTTTRIVAPTSAKKTYICYLFLTSAAADNVGIVEGTGGTCGTGTAGVIGGTTAANGPNFAANGGAAFSAGGVVAAAVTAGTNVDLCLITSASTPLAGVIKWVQAP